MKILHAAAGWPPEDEGDAAAYVLRLARAQVAAGHEVAVLAGSASDRYDAGVSEVDAEGGPRVFRVSRRGPYPDRWDHGASPFVESGFRDLIERLRPEVFHLHGWHRLSRTLVRQATRQGVRSVVTLHDAEATCPRRDRIRADEPHCERAPSVESCVGCVPRESWALDGVVAEQVNRYLKDLDEELDAATLWVVPSASQADFSALHTGRPRERFRVVAAPTRTEPAAAPAGEAWSPEDERPLRLAHWGHGPDGALEAHEGAFVLLEALPLLEQPERVALALWGSAPDPEYALVLDELVGEWETASGTPVERRALVSDADLAGLEADAACLPTLSHDGVGARVDRALALGLPVLVSDRGALAERAGGAALAFRAGDAPTLAAAIDRLVAEPGLLAELRARVRPGPTLEEHARELEAVYREVLARESVPLAAPDGVVDRQRWERVAIALEEQGRHLAGLRRAAEREVERLRDEVSTEFAALCEERARGHEAQARLAEKAAALESLEGRLAEREGELRTVSVRAAEVRTERDTVVHALEQRLAERDRAATEHEAKARELEVRLAELTAERNTIVHALETRVGEQFERAGRLEGELAERAAQVASLEARIAEHRAELEAAAARFAGAEEEHLARAAELEEAAARVAAARREIGEREETIRGLERENRLALPLVLPARGILWVWDKLRT